MLGLRLIISVSQFTDKNSPNLFKKIRSYFFWLLDLLIQQFWLVTSSGISVHEGIAYNPICDFLDSVVEMASLWFHLYSRDSDKDD
jgi:hypothetical protein